jgi:hypothetical protein
MALHIAPKVLHVRFYPDDVEVKPHLYQMSSGYLAHMLILINDLGVGRVEGLNGLQGVPVSMLRSLKRQLPSFGVIRLEWRHNGREHRLNF